MTDSHAELDRQAHVARERLFATLDVLDQRAHKLVDKATLTTRATAIGFAGAIGLSIGLAFAQAASRRVRRGYSQRPAQQRSILGEALRVSAVAITFVALSAWAKRALRREAILQASAPQVGRAGTAGTARLLPAPLPADGTVDALYASRMPTDDPGADSP